MYIQNIKIHHIHYNFCSIEEKSFNVIIKLTLILCVARYSARIVLGVCWQPWQFSIWVVAEYYSHWLHNGTHPKLDIHIRQHWLSAIHVSCLGQYGTTSQQKCLFYEIHFYLWDIKWEISSYIIISSPHHVYSLRIIYSVYVFTTIQG